MVTLTNDGKVPGKPFLELQQQIDVLNQQVTAFQQAGVIGYSTKSQLKELTLEPGDIDFTCAEASLGKHVVGDGGISGGPFTIQPSLTMVGSKPVDGHCNNTYPYYSISMDSWCVTWRNDTGQTWDGDTVMFNISVGEEYTGQWVGCE